VKVVPPPPQQRLQLPLALTQCLACSYREPAEMSLESGRRLQGPQFVRHGPGDCGVVAQGLDYLAAVAAKAKFVVLPAPGPALRRHEPLPSQSPVVLRGQTERRQTAGRLGRAM
jgi:hypothetical protein